MMTITRRQIGNALGFALLTFIILALSYGVTAFIAWEWNPGRWSVTFRAIAIGFAVGLPLLRAGLSRIQIASEPDEPE